MKTMSVPEWYATLEVFRVGGRQPFRTFVDTDIAPTRARLMCLQMIGERPTQRLNYVLSATCAIREA